jgi:hypothetical protein
MANVKVKQNSPMKYVFLITIIIGILIIGYKNTSVNKSSSNFENSDSNGLNEKYEDVTSKGGYDKLSFEDWKVIANHDAQKYYENMQNLTYADMYATEAFITSYNNDWVTFRNSLDDYANLSSDQCELLKDFYQKTRDEMSERVKKKLEDNDKKLRPNKYK